MRLGLLRKSLKKSFFKATINLIGMSIELYFWNYPGAYSGSSPFKTTDKIFIFPDSISSLKIIKRLIGYFKCSDYRKFGDYEVKYLEKG